MRDHGVECRVPAMGTMKWVSGRDERPSSPSFQLRKGGRRDTSSACHRLKHIQLMISSNVIQLHNIPTLAEWLMRTRQYRPEWIYSVGWIDGLPSRWMFATAVAVAAAPAAEWFAGGPTPIRCCPPHRNRFALYCPATCTTANIPNRAIEFRQLNTDTTL